MASKFWPIIFLSIIILSQAAVAQSSELRSTISGVVVDQVTREPIMAANVYISNTLWGSATDTDGYYQIKSVPPGIHELVVSIVGYQFESKMVLIVEDSSLLQNFSLKPLIYETESTEVVGDIPKDWLDNLEVFKKYFLGRSVFAEECIIKNAEVLEFKNPSSQVLQAYTDIPLVIENHALGFVINTILMDFKADQIVNRWEWSVKPAFTEMESNGSGQRKIWEQNRLEAFLGSREHFLISTINRELEDQGFTVYEVDYPGKRSALRESIHTVLPYEDILKKGNKKEEVILHFKSYLCVIHNYDKISWIRLNYPEVTIGPSGNPQEFNPFEVYGYWAEYGMGSALPQYFLIKQD